VLYSALHLRPGAREWYFHWLEREHPHLVPRYRELFGGGSYAQKDYRRWLAEKISPLIRDHGLERGHVDTATGTLRSTALARPRSQVAGPSLIAEERPIVSLEVGPQPTLF
jgi:hypothetical protein